MILQSAWNSYREQVLSSLVDDDLIDEYELSAIRAAFFAGASVVCACMDARGIMPPGLRAQFDDELVRFATTNDGMKPN